MSSIRMLALGACLALLAATVRLVAAGPSPVPAASPPASATPTELPMKYHPGDRPAVPENKQVVTLKTTKGNIKIRLHPEDAPIACDNFVQLVDKGFYNGTLFHRVTAINVHVAQGGDPTGRGDGGPGWRIPFEHSPRNHTLGAVGMARGPDKDSAGSQFYMCLDPLPQLDGGYVVFGEVIEGMDVAWQLQFTQDPYSGAQYPASVPRDKILEATTGQK